MKLNDCQLTGISLVSEPLSGQEFRIVASTPSVIEQLEYWKGRGRRMEVDDDSESERINDDR